MKNLKSILKAHYRESFKVLNCPEEPLVIDFIFATLLLPVMFLFLPIIYLSSFLLRPVNISFRETSKDVVKDELALPIKGKVS